MDTALRYREAAEQLRAIATNDPDLRTSDVLRLVADEYERTARNLEALERTNRRHLHDSHSVGAH